MRNKIKFNILKYAGEPIDYPAGSKVFSQGDPGDSMFVVVKGKVDIMAGDKVVDSLEDGDIFGEMALIDNQARSADAVAATDCSLVKIDERRFLYMTDNTPRFALQVMRMVAFRLRDRMADLEQLRSEQS
jgi:CRP-like cAMP-binding protein